MNRRTFLRRLCAGVAGALVAPHLALAEPVTPIFTELVAPGGVGEFVCYYYWQGELLCDNPAQSAFIVGITD